MQRYRTFVAPPTAPSPSAATRRPAPRLPSCLTLLLLLGLLVGPAFAAPPLPNARYTLHIAGYYHGTGSAARTGRILNISGTVQTDDGASGTLDAKIVHLKGNTFTGAGLVLGHPATFSGRFDVPPAHSDPGQPDHGRLVITFSVVGGHAGRIVGVAQN